MATSRRHCVRGVASQEDAPLGVPICSKLTATPLKNTLYAELDIITPKRLLHIRLDVERSWINPLFDASYGEAPEVVAIDRGEVAPCAFSSDAPTYGQCHTTIALVVGLLTCIALLQHQMEGCC